MSNGHRSWRDMMAENDARKRVVLGPFGFALYRARIGFYRAQARAIFAFQSALGWTVWALQRGCGHHSSTIVRYLADDNDTVAFFSLCDFCGHIDDEPDDDPARSDAYEMVKRFREDDRYR